MNTLTNKKIHHIHIPKTGGSYLRNSFLIPFFDKTINAGEYYEMNLGTDEVHHCWPVEDKGSYLVSSFRDPVKRTVSHYCEIFDFPRFEIKPNIYDFRKWVESNANYLSNFQSKNFIYSFKESDDEKGDRFFYKLSGFLNINNVEINDVKEKINRLNIFIRNTQMTENNMIALSKKIVDDLKSKINFNFFQPLSVNNISNDSLDLYSMLTQDDIAYLYELNSVDNELFLNDSLFWNNGK